MNTRRALALVAVVLTAQMIMASALADAPAAARHQEQTADNNSETLPAPLDEEAPKSVAPENVPPGTLAGREDAWRYRYHLGRWWYYVEPKHWLFWDGDCWQDARPQTPKIMPDGSVQRVGLVRRALAAWPQVPSYREHHGWIGGFYSSGGGYGSSDFGYGYGIPSYGPGSAYVNGELSGPTFTK